MIGYSFFLILSLLSVHGCEGGLAGRSAQPPQPLPAVDISNAVIVAWPPEALHGRAAGMLRDEIERRTGIRMAIASALPEDNRPAIVLAREGQSAGIVLPLPAGLAVPAEAEGFAIWIDRERRTAPVVSLVGRDDRGVLYAAGRLIRLLHMGRGRIAVGPDLRLATAPRYPYRGFQIACRDLSSAYDAWDLNTYEQYIRDLVIFGTNTIELIPTAGRDQPPGPLMKKSSWRMQGELSQLIASYGLNVWAFMNIHESAIEPPEAERASLAGWRAMFASMQALDAVFVAGGDGDRVNSPPAKLIPVLERLAAVLHEVHPHATLWLSNQAFRPADNDYLFNYLQTRRPDWFGGLIYGPYTKIKLEEARRRLPARYPIVRYDDVGHCVRGQYNIPDWDRAFSRTLGREAICPRPRAMAHIQKKFAPLAQGFVAYSDGVNDDLNKCEWSAMGWDPDLGTEAFLQEYCRAFFGAAAAGAAAQGLIMLEENWVGPIDRNTGIERTLTRWQSVADHGGPALGGEWRFQMYLFRAFYDAYLQRKARAEAACEASAYNALRRAPQVGAGAAIQSARKALAGIDRQPAAPQLRKRIEALGLDLFKSIGYQMSIREPFKAIYYDRSTMLDALDRPLNDRLWLEAEFEKILAEPKPAERLKMIERIVNWENPGPGGYYDDLGRGGRQPRLVRAKDWEDDPDYIESPQSAYALTMDKLANEASKGRLSWQDYAETLYGTPLRMRYEGLESGASYRLRVTYAGRYNPTMRLLANGKHEIHGPIESPEPMRPLEFKVPREATRDGVLELEWLLVDKRGCQVSEVWLIKEEK